MKNCKNIFIMKHEIQEKTTADKEEFRTKEKEDMERLKAMKK